MKLLLCSLLFVFSSFVFAQEVLHFKAQYKIPVVDRDLEALGTFELVNYTAISNGKDSSLSYELPFLMTGIKSQKVEMKLAIEKLPLRVFEGPKAVALCEGPWAKMKCSIRFKAIDMHYGRVERELIREGVAVEEIKNRLDILRAFGQEPIGETSILVD